LNLHLALSYASVGIRLLYPFELSAVAMDASGQQVTTAPVNISVALANDRFTNRVQLDGYQFAGFGTTAGAGAEPRRTVPRTAGLLLG